MASSSTLSPTMASGPSANRSSISSRGSSQTQNIRSASSLGARPISSTTFQSRNGFAITPDSSAPSSPPPTVPLQPSIKALPPPMLAASSYSSSSRSHTTPQTTSGPNYNLSFSPQAPSMTALQPSSNSFMQPLQPQQSSLSQPPVQSTGIQWNTITPLAPQNAAPPAVNWSAATPSQGPSSNPPGWSGSTVLQPTKKETTFDWGDLDPMR